MVRWFLLGVALWASVAWPAEVQGQSVRATVLSIGDGDTIRVRQAGRALTVRLACIDAPETAQSPWGQQARRYLQQRLPIGREVTLEVKTTDRYGRTVAEVISDINLNLVMVEDGQAFAYRQYLGAAMPRSIWMLSSGPAGIAMGCGRWRAASPAPGISAVEAAAQR